MEPVEVREDRVAAGGVSSGRVGVYPVAYRAVNLVWLIVGIVITILAFDFFFRLAKANDVGFADFIYSVGGSLAAPFDGIFGINRTVSTLSLVRWSDLIAMIVYSLVGLAIVKGVKIACAPGPARTDI